MMTFKWDGRWSKKQKKQSRIFLRKLKRERNPGNGNGFFDRAIFWLTLALC
jgi:hypothetical protein